MDKNKKISLAAILLMTVFSLLSIFDISFKDSNINFASLALIIGIIMYFVIARMENSNNSLNFKMIPSALKNINIVILLLPVFANIISFVIAKLFLPTFLEHLKLRTNFLVTDQVVFLVIQLLISAVGEEIAWRGFFQNQLSKILPFISALIISSALFAICHCTRGILLVVLYDLLFIFINAILYGLIYRKTNNLFISSLAHFSANLFGIIVIYFL